MTTEGRRPIRREERPHLLMLGAALRLARVQAGLTVRELSERSGIDRRHLHRLERGERRTRASTLDRIVAAAEPDPERRDVLRARLITLAGPALAPESPYADRILRRRLRREARRLQATRNGRR